MTSDATLHAQLGNRVDLRGRWLCYLANKHAVFRLPTRGITTAARC